MKTPPAVPAATVLFVVGPALPGPGMPIDPYTYADYLKAGQQLQALGYNIISAADTPEDQRATTLAKCHGVATTDQFTEQNAGAANMQLLGLAYRLNMPDLPVISWAKCAAPEAAEWYPEVFEGAL